MTRLAAFALPFALFACATPEVDDQLEPLQVAPADRLAAPIALGLDATAGVAGEITTFTVTGLNAGESVTLLQTDDNVIGEGNCYGLIGAQCLDIVGNVRIAGTGVADPNGIATVDVAVRDGIRTGFERAFQAFAIRGSGGVDSVASNPERLRLSNDLARLRVVHASPDAPAVDVYANGGLLLPNVPFGAQSGFLDVPADTYVVDIRAAGADPSSTPVFSQTFDLMANETYNVLATGFLTSTDPADGFRLLPLVDGWGDIDPSSIRARIVHSSPDAPAVGIDVGNDGTVEIPGVPFTADSGAEGVALPADSVLPVGIRDANGNAVTSFTIPPLAAGEEAIVIAFGELGRIPSANNGFALIALLRDGNAATIKQDPIVYALHASPGAPNVDVLAGGAPLITDLAFRELSGAVQVPPGAYDLDVNVAGTTNFVETFSTPPLEAGSRYLVTASGFVGGTPAFQPIITVADFNPNDADGRVTLVHASPDAPAVDIGSDSQGMLTPLVTDVPFTGQTRTAGISVVPGTYDIGVAVAGDMNTLFAFPGVEVFGGDRAIYLATGSVAAADFGITIVDTTTAPWSAVTATPAP